MRGTSRGKKREVGTHGPTVGSGGEVERERVLKLKAPTISKKITISRRGAGKKGPQPDFDKLREAEGVENGRPLRGEEVLSKSTVLTNKVWPNRGSLLPRYWGWQRC